VDSMVAAGRYRQLPDGGVVPDGGSSDIAGSMMGKSGTMKVQVSYADLRPVR